MLNFLFRFGRRLPMLVTSLLFVIVSFASCAIPNYLTFILTRLLMSVVGTIRDNTGILLGGIWNITLFKQWSLNCSRKKKTQNDISFCYVAVELVGPSWRVFVTVAWLIFWSVGYIILAALAYAITGWRYLQAALTVLDLLLFIAFIMYVLSCNFYFSHYFTITTHKKPIYCWSPHYFIAWFQICSRVASLVVGAQ